MSDLHVQDWPVARLRPYALNPRKNDAALARKLEALAPHEFEHIKPIFDDFFEVLPRVRDNMVMVDAAESSEHHAVLQ